LLRNAKVHVHRIQRLERHNRIARREVLAEIDLAKAKDARKRRSNRLSLDGRANLSDPGLRLLLPGDRCVVIRARDDAFLQQSLRPAVAHTCKVALRLNGCQLRSLLSRVQLNQHLALTHPLS
jgi:hypothetical protein